MHRKTGGAGRKGRFALAVPQSRGLATLSIEELLRGCQEGREDAWEEFLRRYGDLIHSTIRRRGGLSQTDDREDAFQNAVLTIYRNLPTLRQPDRLVPWIVRIAYTHGIDGLRMRKRLRETAIDDLSDSTLNEEAGIEDTARSLEEERLALERAQCAREALDRLPERCRGLIRLLFYEDPPLEYAEVAKRAILPIGSIGPTRARCLEKMRRILADSPSPVSGGVPAASVRQKARPGIGKAMGNGGAHR